METKVSQLRDQGEAERGGGGGGVSGGGVRGKQRLHLRVEKQKGSRKAELSGQSIEHLHYNRITPSTTYYV